MTYWGELAALGTACCWTVTSMSFESAGRRVGSLPVNLIRLVMAAVVLSLFGWISRGFLLPTDATVHQWLWLALSGLVGFCIGDLCLFRAFVVLGSRLAMLVFSLTPLITALTGWAFLGERLSGTDWLGMAMTISGVAWVVTERSSRRRPVVDGLSAQASRSGPQESAQVARASGSAPQVSGPVPQPGGPGPLAGGPAPPGDQPAPTRRTPAQLDGLTLVKGILLGLGGCFGQGVGLVMSKHGMGSYDAFAATQIRVMAGVVGFALIFTVIGWWPKVFTALRHGTAMARTGVGAFFGPVLGVSLSLIAVRHTPTGVAATIFSLVPVLIIVPTILIFKERVSVRAILGAVIAVAGVALLFLA